MAAIRNLAGPHLQPAANWLAASHRPVAMTPSFLSGGANLPRAISKVPSVRGSMMVVVLASGDGNCLRRE